MLTICCKPIIQFVGSNLTGVSERTTSFKYPQPAQKDDYQNERG